MANAHGPPGARAWREATGDRHQATAQTPRTVRRTLPGADHRRGPMMHPLWPRHDGQATPTTVLDRDFDSDTLSTLRQAVLQRASAAGVPAQYVSDVVLAIHELAANAVRHGAGHGHLLMQVTIGTLHCQVSDPGLATRGFQGPDTPQPAPWPVQRGHGLWLVRNAATQVHAITGPAGSLVSAQFPLPPAPWPAASGQHGLVL